MYLENSKVTVIIPAYNSERYIADAIQSILNQTYKNIELIVVNDCSTDNTHKELLKFNSERIKIIQQDKNSGYAACINKALQIASGHYIARMDASDISHPLRIETQIQLHKNHPDAAFVSCNRYRISPGGVKFRVIGEKNSGISFVYWEDIIKNSRTFVDPGTIIEKQKLMEVGGYRTYQRSGMDVDLWLRLLEKFGKGVVCNQLLYGHRLETDSIIFNQNTNFKNTIPRILAKQRKVLGFEDLFIAEKALSEMTKKGEKKENYQSLVGLSSTCLYLTDIRGFFISLRRQKRLSGNYMLFDTFKKALSRGHYIEKIRS